MGRLRNGVHQPLEDAATALIKESLAGVTSRSAKSDILTPWKEIARKRREVYVPGGTPDAATRSGVFGRAWNPVHSHLNSRDGNSAARRMPSGLADFYTATYDGMPVEDSQ
jgi:hypothetical protein